MAEINRLKGLLLDLYGRFLYLENHLPNRPITEFTRTKIPADAVFGSEAWAKNIIENEKEEIEKTYRYLVEEVCKFNKRRLKKINLSESTALSSTLDLISDTPFLVAERLEKLALLKKSQEKFDKILDDETVFSEGLSLRVFQLEKSFKESVPNLSKQIKSVEQNVQRQPRDYNNLAYINILKILFILKEAEQGSTTINQEELQKLSQETKNYFNEAIKRESYCELKFCNAALLILTNIKAGLIDSGEENKELERAKVYFKNAMWACPDHPTSFLGVICVCYRLGEMDEVRFYAGLIEKNDELKKNWLLRSLSRKVLYNEDPKDLNKLLEKETNPINSLLLQETIRNICALSFPNIEKRKSPIQAVNCWINFGNVAVDKDEPNSTDSTTHRIG